MNVGTKPLARYNLHEYTGPCGENSIKATVTVPQVSMSITESTKMGINVLLPSFQPGTELRALKLSKYERVFSRLLFTLLLNYLSFLASVLHHLNYRSSVSLDIKSSPPALFFRSPC